MSTYVNQLTNNTVTVFVSGARNFATDVKNWRQKPTPVFCRQSEACVIGIRSNSIITIAAITQDNLC